MKLGDFNLLDDDQPGDDLSALVAKFNANTTAYPRESTVHAEFARQAAETPNAAAVVGPEGPHSYAEVAVQAHRIAHLLKQRAVPPEGLVGVMLDDAFDIASTLLGILEAGGAYLPLDPTMPLARTEHMLRETKAQCIIGGRRHIRMLNRLQWECPQLEVLLCVDSVDVQAEPEGIGELMREEIWDMVGDEMVDDISGGGWRSSYTGELLSREVMDAYGENIRTKLGAILRPTDQVLEVGCSSGISMFRLAPMVSHYHGIDLSARILRWTEQEQKRLEQTNITLQHLPAHELRQVPDRGYNVVIINSVLQCFSGLNYLRDVLRNAIDKLQETGTVFLGNIWDQDLKAEFEAELRAWQRKYQTDGSQTKTDRSEDLFVSRDFWLDLQAEWPEIAAVEFSTMLGEAESELSRFGYDTILRIDKKQTTPTPRRPRRKHQLDARAISPQPAEPLSEQAGPHSLAYVIYTSGTAGRPKGTLIEHRSILRLVRETNYINITPADRIIMTGALAFDASTFEIWGALLNGAAVCRPRDRDVLDTTVVKRLIADHGITVMFLTTGLCNQLVDTDVSLFAHLRTLLTGGEKLSAPHINRLRAAHPDLSVVSCYGPTENTTFTSTFPIKRDYTDNIPIGRPIANTSIHILDSHDQMVPLGVVGELCTGGDGLARGYLNDPELTAAKFFPNPFDSAPDSRLYRTGDLARWQEDGTVEFIGRRDQQVKIRGFRIEPGEIEFRLREQPQVKDAAVIAADLGDGSLSLVAYVVGSAEPDHLRRSLAAELPPFMVPAHVIPLEVLPLNPNGKIDRNALPLPALPGGDDSRSREPAANETERTVLSLWEDVLDQPGLGVTDNFFSVGGHSLKVTKLAALLRDTFEIHLPLTALFKASTVREQAALLLDAAQFGTEGIDETMVRLNPQAEARATPLFLFPPGTGDALGYLQLAQLLSDRAIYGFNFLPATDRLTHYANLVCETQKEGVLILGGYSAGGNLAYHLAGLLEQRGRHVAAVIMFDSAQVVKPIVFPPDECAKVTAAFLNHESITPYVSTPLLREKVARIIAAYYDHMSHTLDRHTIAADIHALVCDDSTDYRDERGTVVSRTHGWRDVTRGSYHIHSVRGSHNEILYPPNLDTNAKTLRDILTQISS